jgi:hypothetical protein
MKSRYLDSVEYPMAARARLVTAVMIGLENTLQLCLEAIRSDIVFPWVVPHPLAREQ